MQTLRDLQYFTDATWFRRAAPPRRTAINSAADTVQPDHDLVLALCDDPDAEVQIAALEGIAGNHIGFKPAQELAGLYPRIAATAGFRQHGEILLSALARYPASLVLPDSVLDLGTSWVQHHKDQIRHPGTTAHAGARHLFEIVDGHVIPRARRHVIPQVLTSSMST